jgi:hypothetical protein
VDADIDAEDLPQIGPQKGLLREALQQVAGDADAG